MNDVKPGTSVIAHNTVTVPASTQGNAAASAKWRLVDNFDSLWAEGNAELKAPPQATGGNYVHQLQATINIPDSMPPSDGGTTYSLIWEVEFAGLPAYITTETIDVIGNEMHAFGAKHCLVGAGTEAIVSWVVPQDFLEVTAVLVTDNRKVREFSAAEITKSDLGSGAFKYEIKFETTDMMPSLEPHNVAWSGKLAGDNIDADLSQLYVITMPMWNAATDVEHFLQRSYQTVAGQRDLVFTPGSLMTFLREGADLFNTLYLPTRFTMLNAKGPIRSGWQACTRVQACRSEYLAEGMKAFEFTGQNVTLSADRTQYWESLAAQIEGTFDNTIRPLKVNLSRRGQTTGDGSQDGLSIAPRSVGAVGVTVSPIANLRGLHGSGAHWYGGWLRRTW